VITVFSITAAAILYVAVQAQSPQVSPSLFAGLHWRNIGPFHGGRISAVTGVIGEAGTFYMGTPQGGAWKTTSAGVTWSPIFDDVTEADGIGAIQVAPSDPNIVYVGTGDSVGGPSGNGMYKSSDAGRTWTHIGLGEALKINKLVVDPRDPNLVLASATGDTAGHGSGVFRSADGGQTWQNVLEPEDGGGTRDLEYAFDRPTVMFATTQGTSAPRGGAPAAAGGGTPAGKPARIFKSTDEGKTWTEIKSLPAYPGRISVAIAMHTNGERVYVVGSAIENGSGVCRSDDGGATWKHVGNGESRVSNGQGNYGSGVWVDSQNPDIVYVASVPLYRSTDGGNTFTVFKGAPGGEDYHCMWIDPTSGQRMLLGADQGASVTLDGGKTWSSWYNQPVGQIYHVSTDTRYPYWVMGAEQDTGAVMTRSRGNFGQINVFDASPLPSSEFGTITADPLHPEILYGVGYGVGQGGSGLIKIDMATGQWGNVAPNFGADSTKYRASRDFWKRFDTSFEPTAMYVGYQCLVVTRDGAKTWTAFSPDLTTPKGQPLVPCGTPRPPAPSAEAGTRGGAPAAPPAPAGGGRGGAAGPTIADFSLSTVRKGVVWTVSSNGQIFNTIDGGLHWNNVSNVADAPASVSFSTIEAGHRDVGTAYLAGRATAPRGGPAPAAGAPPVDTDTPLIWRTHDGGKTWTKIVKGLPTDERTGSWVNVVREDPGQKGLLFAGTETTVYVSFDDGDEWQPMRQDLPSTSIRDMVFHTDHHMNDLVIVTYGRGFWVLDDMSPLRELAVKAQKIAAAPAYLFKPGDAIRARMNANWDQPINRDEPHAPNPPYGAIIYYHLGQPPRGEMTLKVFDAAGHLIRTISSTPPPPIVGVLYTDRWLATPESRSLPTSAGMHRVNWDLRYDDPPAVSHDFQNQMNAIEGLVTPGPHGPQALPGTYTLELTVDGAVYKQTVAVRNDPRVGESPAVMAALGAQQSLTELAYRGAIDTYGANDEVTAVRNTFAALRRGQLPQDVASQATGLDATLGAFGGAAGGRGGRGAGGGAGFGAGGRGGGPAGPSAVTSFIALNGTFNSLVSVMQVGLDMGPTRAQIDTWESGCRSYNATVAAWKKAQAVDLAAFGALLAKNGLPELTVTPTKLTVRGCTFAPPAPQPAPRGLR
jgi:photosystem II stability/assembly factor-like uncharacterized protein